MASTTPKTILLDTNEESGADRKRDSAIVKAASPVTPGDLITFDTGEVKPNATAADADAQIMFAVEPEFTDPRIDTGAAIDTDWAAAETCDFIYPQRGDLIYGWIEAAGNVVKGDPLESASGGDLQAWTNGRIIGFAAENKDNSGGGGHVRIRVRIA